MGFTSRRNLIFGRETERKLISESLAQVANTESRTTSKVLLLSGMSGVGKSALAQSAIQEATELGFDVYQTACEPFHEGMSFFPVREIVRQISAGRSPAALMTEQFGEGSSQVEMAQVSESMNVDPSSRREALVATFTNVILGRFQDPAAKPILIYFDDLEFLDTGSADALICLVSRMGEGRVALLGAFRSDRVVDQRHPLRSLISSSKRIEGTYTELRLDQFEENSFQSLVNVMLEGETNLPKSFYDKLYQETEGNPLFTREVLRMLSASKPDGSKADLAMEDGKWIYSGDVDLWGIPVTVEGVIASRLDFLEPDERKELEFASVIGRRFAFEVLIGVLESGEDDLVEAIERFLGFDIIRELDHRSDEFEFSHGKIRQVIYESISGLRKRRIHGQVAAVLMELMSSANEDWDAIIGDHLYQAGKRSEAFPYLLRAARNNSKTGSDNAAVKFYRKALETTGNVVFESDDSRLTIELELAEALIASSETNEAGALLENLTYHGVPADIRMRALNLLGDALLFDGEIEQAYNSYKKSEALAESLGSTLGLCEALCDISELLGREYEKQAGLNPAKADKHRSESIQSVERAYSHRDEIPSGQLKARILRNKAKLSRVSGRLDEAAQLYRESFESSDSKIHSHRFLIPYVKTLRRLGETDEALRILEQVSSWSTQVNSDRSRAIAAHWRAMVLMSIATSSDDLTTAWKLGESALHTHKSIGYKQGIHETEMILGEIALRIGNYAEALSRFRNSVGAQPGTSAQLVEAVASELEANGEEDRSQYVRDWAQTHASELE